ncbi:MAG: hypothetical protein ABI254_09255 [Chthoniobacterales bacterium]
MAAPLATSYRSDKAVIEVINQVFENIAAIKLDLELPDATVKAWEQTWVPHQINDKKALDG